MVQALEQEADGRTNLTLTGSELVSFPLRGKPILCYGISMTCLKEKKIGIILELSTIASIETDCFHQCFDSQTLHSSRQEYQYIFPGTTSPKSKPQGPRGHEGECLGHPSLSIPSTTSRAFPYSGDQMRILAGGVIALSMRSVSFNRGTRKHTASGLSHDGISL